MKKVIFATIAMFVLSINMQAQKNVKNTSDTTKRKCGNEQKHKKAKAIAKALDLTEAQKAELKAYKATQKEKVATIKKSSLTEDEKKTKIKTIKEESKTKLESILTAEQKAKLATLKNKKGKGKRG